jgi:hypothetical protein
MVGNLCVISNDVPTFYSITNPVHLLVFVSLTVGLREKRIGFDPRPVTVGFVVDKVALVQVSIPVLLFSSVTIIPPIFLTHISPI